MSESAELMASRIEERFGERLLSCSARGEEVTIELAPAHLLEVAAALRDEEPFAFGQLMDVCAVDYGAYGRADWETSEVATSSGYSRGVATGEVIDQERRGARFASIYHLLSLARNQRLRMRVPLEGDPPVVPSVVDIWSSANWFEREAFDLFGVLYDGHPDLRRILTDYGFIGHPFRKDFPLIGNVEVRYDAGKRRVVYEPVSIEPRTLVPRVIRHDHRYLEADPAAEGSESVDA